MEALLLLVLGIALVIASAWARWEGLFPQCAMGCMHEEEPRKLEETGAPPLLYGLT